MLRNLLRKAGLFLLVGIARRPSVAEKVEPEAAAPEPEPDAEAAATLGGKVPIPATTGAIFCDEVEEESGAADVGVADGAGVTSVGLTTGDGVAGDSLAAWKG